jgi:ABC-2 type transport system ATP-binding protein
MPSAPAASPVPPSAAEPGAAAVLQARGLSRRHRLPRPSRRDRRSEGGDGASDGGWVQAVAGVDLDVAPAEVFGLLGPNGAGKTTLVRMLAGLLRPDVGTVRLLGRDLADEPGLAARAVASLAQDEPVYDELTVAAAVESTARLRALSRAAARAQTADLLAELGLEPLAERVIGRLSGGQRRLAHVATALTGDRPVLLLDEPTTGLDPEARRAVWAALERRRAGQGVTVVLVTHNVLEAEAVLDRVAVLERGRVIACDTPGRLKASVSDEVRLDLVWRDAPPRGESVVAELGRRASVTGRRWSVRLPQAEAREALGRLTAGPALAALDDFTLATPSLEDVYLALGGTARDLERA